MQSPTLPIADLIPFHMFVSCEGAVRTWPVVGNFFMFFQVLKIFLMIKQLLFQTTCAPFRTCMIFQCVYIVLSSKFNFLTVQFALHSVVVSVLFVNRWYFAVNQVKFTCKVLMFQSIFTVSHDVYNILIASCLIVSFRK